MNNDRVAPNQMGGHRKVTAAHLAREAYIYIRQSTVKQVIRNRESQENQRRMVGRAQELGWAAERIQVIDEDQGLSGSGSAHRPGYQHLVAEVSLGRVGIIIGYEVSRLARNNGDWYHLLDLAGVFGTLIADSDGVYNPQHFNDRLLLGLKGTMSEAELHLLKQRLEAGRMRQVERGEYRQKLPTGLVRAADGRVEKDPDTQVQHAIELVLTKYAELGSSSQVLLYLRGKGIRLPRQQVRGPDQGQVVWREATDSMVYEILRNPAYAGAFVYGRKQSDPARRRGGQPASGRVRKQPGEWLQKKEDVYPAYISWEQYEANQKRLAENGRRAWGKTMRTQGAAREGPALLQGMVVCGKCGHRCQVAYRRGAGYRYQCHAMRKQYGEIGCESIHGPVVDQVVVGAFFEALRPAQLDVLAEVLAGQAEEQARLERQWGEQIQRAEYEVERARRQYMQVEPENRLVAAELERRWEEKLEQRQAIVGEIEERRRRAAKPQPLSEEMRARFGQISERLPELWDGLRPVQQKSLLRSLIETVVVRRTARDRVEIKIVWVSGHYSVMTTQVPVGRKEEISGYEAMKERVGELYREGQDDQAIAEELSKEGYHSAHRSEVTEHAVKIIRKERGWPHKTGTRPVMEIEGRLTTAGLAAQLGVQRRWVQWRLNNGAIPNRYVTRDPKTGWYLIENDPELIERLRRTIGKRIRFKRKGGN